MKLQIFSLKGFFDLLFLEMPPLFKIRYVEEVKRGLYREKPKYLVHHRI